MPQTRAGEEAGSVAGFDDGADPGGEPVSDGSPDFEDFLVIESFGVQTSGRIGDGGNAQRREASVPRPEWPLAQCSCRQRRHRLGGSIGSRQASRKRAQRSIRTRPHGTESRVLAQCYVLCPSMPRRMGSTYPGIGAPPSPYRPRKRRGKRQIEVIGDEHQGSRPKCRVDPPSRVGQQKPLRPECMC